MMLAGALVVCACLAASALARTVSAGNSRVVGTFSMTAKVTSAVGVDGEHRGQTLHRTWTLATSGCIVDKCRSLRLVRTRGGGVRQRLTLHRVGRGRFRVSGAFYVALGCNGRTYRHGSRVPFTITLTVIARETDGGIRFARRLAATYTNPRRTDTTPCPLGPSHDAATYTGTLITALPAAPAASFTARTRPVGDTVSFADTSTSPSSPIKRIRWDFGDPGSGAADRSSTADPTHTFSRPGTYTVTLAVTDTRGLTGTVSRSVIVPSPPGPTPPVASAG